MVTKKYLGSILLVVVCCISSAGFAQDQQKEYYAFDRDVTTLILSNGNVVLRSNELKTSGKYKVIENELHMIDTVLNAEALYLDKQTFNDPAVGNNEKRLRLVRHSTFIPLLTSYKNGDVDTFQIVTDSIIYLRSGVDSFFISFLGIDARSITYLVDQSYNLIMLSVPDNLLNSLSLGNEISYQLNDGDKINFFYYRNGRLQQKYLYASRKALIKDMQSKLKEFKRTGYWGY